MVLRLALQETDEPPHMNRILPRTAGIATAVICSLTLAAQTTVAVTPSKDNTLYEDIVGGNSNALGHLFVGRNANGLGNDRRAVLHFDIAAAVPAGAVVIGAELIMEITNSLATTTDAAKFHRVSQDWGEGTSGQAPGTSGGVDGGGFGYPSTTGDATWLHAFYTTTTWTTPGGDYNALSSFQISMPPTGAPFTSLQISTANEAGMIADVQDMLDNPASNFGWIMIADFASQIYARRIGSRESTGVVPTLNITYLLQSEVGRVGVGCPVGGGTSELDFVGAAIGGQNVTIQRTNHYPGSVGADFFSLYIDPLGVPLQPGCTVYLPLAQELIPGGAFLSLAGSSSAPFAVPAGFPGFLISCQTVVIDNSPFGLSLSNAAVMVLQ